MKTYKKNQKYKMMAFAFCLLALAAATAPAAMLHLTDDYRAQSTSSFVTPGVPFNLDIYADDLAGGGLTGVEFRVNLPPNLFLLGAVPLSSGINFLTSPEFLLGFPAIVPEPGPVAQLTLLELAGNTDLLITLEPLSNYPASIPGEMAYSDPDLNVHTVDYASGFLINPSGLAAPQWVPEPATLSLLAFSGLLLRFKRYR